MSKGMRVLVALLVGASMVFVACGGDDAPDEATTQEEATEETTEEDDAAGEAGLSITAFDFGFREEEVTIPAGETALTFRNTGKAPHTFTIGELGADAQAGPGETVESTFTAEAGSYEFACSIHPDMTGTLSVQ